MLANWKQDPRNLVCLTGGNDGVQFTNMAITEPELTTQQQEPDTQEPNNKTTESEGTTLTTITTRTPTADRSQRWSRSWTGPKYDHLLLMQATWALCIRM